ncbi:hypothetical protein A0H81_07480 [Grifola frondosa]|uniref:Amidase domain-containing protein n=1 Tax=Grifola frondosa TaxID=5627 RepID=A0A1C7M5P9_GRIFR|nr:hypothetical protein A0H81_07480 [Grifola frondosa]
MQPKAKLVASPEVEIVDFSPLKHGEGYDIIRELYFEDGGKAIRAQLAASGEDVLVLMEWVIAPPHMQDHDTTLLWVLHAWRNVFHQAYSDHWRAADCDVVLSLPFPGPANPHDTAKYWGYTAIWNLLDYPGIVFPSGIVVDPAVNVADAAAQPASPADMYNQSIYDPQVMIGAPINLQLTARCFDDTMLMAAQEVVERILKA